MTRVRRLLDVDVLPHLVALLAWSVVWLLNAELGETGHEDPVATWGIIVMFAILPSIVVGLVAGIVEGSRPRLARVLVLGPAAWATLVAFLVVYLFRDLYCGFTGFESCSPSALDRVSGLAGIETVLLIQSLVIGIIRKRRSPKQLNPP